MTTYREIVGKKIKKVTSDPSTGIDGQMWYNSTTGKIRGLAIVSAWSSSGSMITARGFGTADGTQTASLVLSQAALTMQILKSIMVRVGLQVELYQHKIIQQVELERKQQHYFLEAVTTQVVK